MKLSMMAVLLMAFQLTAFAQSNSKCPDMAKFRSPGLTLEISRAEIVPAGRAPGARGGAPGPELPAHCRIDGTMDRRTGTDGKTYGTRFAIALPDNFDFLTAAVNWVEKNSPPVSVTATGRAFPGRSRPLCAYPEHAHYSGKGNPEDAANFTCRP